MKVTFQRAVEFSDIPFKIEEIYNECLEQLKMLNSLSQGLDVSNPNFVIRIDSIRRKMLDIDSKLEECSMLMQSYSNALEKMEEPQVPTMPSDSSIDAPPIPEEFLDLGDE